MENCWISRYAITFQRNSNTNSDLLLLGSINSVLMSSNKDYVAVFTSILKLLDSDGEQIFPKVEEFMMDFEVAIWQVCSVYLPKILYYLPNYSNIFFFFFKRAKKFSRRSSRLAAHFT